VDGVRSSSYPRDNGDLEEEVTRDNVFAPCIPSLTDDVPYFHAIDNRGGTFVHGYFEFVRVLGKHYAADIPETSAPTMAIFFLASQ